MAALSDTSSQAGRAAPHSLASVEAWCSAYINSRELAYKLSPAPLRLGRTHDWEPMSPALPPDSPGRPPELFVMPRSYRSGSPESAAGRLKLLHTFAHHELQAAELFAWAVLAFPRAPRCFRRGLIAILQEEIRHLNLYVRRLDELGVAFGSLPVRDWFWQRVPLARSEHAFISLMGLGLEAANLDHSARFARRFRLAGDHRSAQIIEVVEREEIRHVAFARRWFSRWRGELRFADWSALLPEPLTPALMQGDPINREARLSAGLDEAFIAELTSWRQRGSVRGQ